MGVCLSRALGFAGPLRQSHKYMWVRPAEVPQLLGQLYDRHALVDKEKVCLAGKHAVENYLPRLVPTARCPKSLRADRPIPAPVPSLGALHGPAKSASPRSTSDSKGSQLA